MRDVPQISVIVPIYNSVPYLQRCVESIIAQTYPHLEILLIDDGSTDGSANLCDTLSEKDARIQVVHKSQNEGLSAARNTGLDMASGTWIGFVDSDDWIAPDMYANLLESLTSLSADVVYGGIVPTEGEKPVTPAVPAGHLLSKDEYFRDFFRMGTQICVFYVWNALYCSSLLEGIRFRNEIRNAEDVDFSFRVAMKARSIARDESALYFYFQNPKSITRRGFSETDFDLISVWDYVVDLCQRDYPDFLVPAKLNRYRVDFTLLMRIILYCAPEQDAQYAQQEKALLQSLRQNHRALLGAPIPLSRKLLLLCICAHLPATKYTLRGIKKMRFRGTHAHE